MKHEPKSSWGLPPRTVIDSTHQKLAVRARGGRSCLSHMPLTNIDTGQAHHGQRWPARRTLVEPDWPRMSVTKETAIEASSGLAIWDFDKYGLEMLVVGMVLALSISVAIQESVTGASSSPTYWQSTNLPWNVMLWLDTAARNTSHSTPPAAVIELHEEWRVVAGYRSFMTLSSALAAGCFVLASVIGSANWKGVGGYTKWR